MRLGAFLAAVAVLAGCCSGRHPLELRRAPYLGVRCRVPNSIRCDRVGLAVWLAGPARSLRATIDGRTFSLRPPTVRGGNWDGTLAHAGMLTPGAPLHVIPDAGRYYWQGRHPVRVTVRLTSGGRQAERVVDLHPGYG